MVSFKSLCFLLALWGAGFQVNAQLSINITAQGDYNISRKDGTVWLQSAPTFFIINNVTYSAADSTLTLKGINQTAEGGYLKYSLTYRANNTDIVASVHVYNVGYLGFSVIFPSGATNTRAGSPDDVICGFPGFRVDPSPARFAYMSFGLSSLEAAIGRWENGSTMVYGGRQGSGPLVLFDKNNNAVAMGPMSSFTLTSLWHDVDGAALYWGIMGGVTQVPAGFQYCVLIVDSQGKVGDVVNYWGMLVKAMASPVAHKKSGATNSVDQGDLLSTVGYWTGPGSAYYAAPVAGKTYEDTLYDVRMDAANVTWREPRVYYKHVEVDDWWYEKGQGGGVKSWVAPRSVFPDGITGMANKTNWLVAATCGVWAPDNTYSKASGGKYNFTAGDSCSLPNDQAFWNELFKDTAESRVRVFVQKDMERQYMCMTSGDSDVSTIMTWLSQLNISTAERNMEVLYSGAIPRLVMEAAFRHTVRPAVQVGPGPVNLTETSLWKVGVANIFIHALGLRPFYGNFRSYSSNKSSGAQLSPALHNVFATLTGSPIAIGDEIGKSDRMLIERCCSAEGRVLSPNIPARPIDDQLQEMAWGSSKGSIGQVWTTFTSTTLNTNKDDNFFQGIIMATAMTRSYDITPTSAGFVFPATTPGETIYSPTKLYSYYDPYILHDFTDQKPFPLSNCSVQDFCLYYVAPVFDFKGLEVVLIGDLTKWVPMSPKRIVRVKVGDTIQVYTRGEPEEKVYIWFHVDQRLQSLEHRISLDGTGMVEYELPHPDSSAMRMATTGVNYVLTVCVFVFVCRGEVW